ncbi:fructose-6-phosphate aldolase [Kosmotoga pacifica]|uniref:Probable transaldolase n=1 Tax=Kosmotoga pacifica TaxID=1330330 RepID=A0A0G2ZDW1_9BACT|nr:fructose-6-phosphate aldolase [Kosmotoga pacifica]AKI97749.1 transaldolase [Kosmotoga pacifica]
MKIFLDTANLAEIKKAVEWGIIDGVTTNPTLVAREGAVFEERIKRICEVVKGPVSAEVTGLDYDSMVSEARALSKLSEHVVVKIPMTPDGVKAVKTLSDEGIKTNVTLVFSTSQAILAMKAGATYISPFVGRLDDISNDGMKIVQEIMKVIDNYGFKTEVIVASVRHPMHVVQAALIGAHIVTTPFKTLEALFKHPLTNIGIERFMSDWHEYRKKLTGENNDIDPEK